MHLQETLAAGDHAIAYHKDKTDLCNQPEGRDLQDPLQGSQAYARALAKAGVLTDKEAGEIIEGLNKVSFGNPLWNPKW